MEIKVPLEVSVPLRGKGRDQLQLAPVAASLQLGTRFRPLAGKR